MVVFYFVYLLVDSLHIVPFLLLNELTPLCEQVDDVCVFKSKRCDCNLDMVHRHIFKTQVGQLVQSLLHLVLDPVAESLHSANVLRVVPYLLFVGPFQELFVDPSLKKFGFESEFDGVVTRSNSFHIPLNVIVLLQLLNVVEIIENHQTHKDKQAGVD